LHLLLSLRNTRSTILHHAAGRLPTAFISEKLLSHEMMHTVLAIKGSLPGAQPAFPWSEPMPDPLIYIFCSFHAGNNGRKVSLHDLVDGGMIEGNDRQL